MTGEYTIPINQKKYTYVCLIVTVNKFFHKENDANLIDINFLTPWYGDWKFKTKLTHIDKTKQKMFNEFSKFFYVCP